ncbi:MAG: ROK family protein [Nocardioides sp.]
MGLSSHHGRTRGPEGYHLPRRWRVTCATGGRPVTVCACPVSPPPPPPAPRDRARRPTCPWASTSAAAASRAPPSTWPKASSPPTGSASTRPSPRRRTPSPRSSPSCSRASRRERAGRGHRAGDRAARCGASAANIDDAWIGTDADRLFTKATGRDVHVVNDADAAGLAEARYGAARGQHGLVIVTTLGTGIGSAFIYRGCWCRTPSSATWRSAAWAPRPGRPTAPGRARGCLGRSGPSDSPSSSAPSSGCSPRPARRRRRGQQEGRRVPAPGAHRHPDRPGQAAQQGRHRGGRSLRPRRIARPG